MFVIVTNVVYAISDSMQCCHDINGHIIPLLSVIKIAFHFFFTLITKTFMLIVSFANVNDPFITLALTFALILVPCRLHV